MVLIYCNIITIRGSNHPAVLRPDGAASKKLNKCLHVTTAILPWVESKPPPYRRDVPYVCIRPQVTVGAIEACIDDVEYALRLMHKASLARQARVAAQTPEGLSSSFRHGGGAGCSQSDGTVSEASALHVLMYVRSEWLYGGLQ